MKVNFDLLTTVEQGGCSAKIPAHLLDKMLSKIPILKNENLLVGTETHDDGAVWKISDDKALIQTTDFFPPMCSDPYDFGQIAAANALSDIFAMGGEVFLAMNLVMFPTRLDMKILEAILLGGAEKIKEAGAVLCGGHTIDDVTPKYGLSVSGFVHPEEITSNSGVKEGDVLILTKALGTGIILAGHKVGETKDLFLQEALKSMKLLNREGARLMRKYKVKGATDITGFGFLGHALKMARASQVKLTLNSSAFPLLSGAYELTELGCLPGACFKNLMYVENETSFSPHIDYNLKMLLLDAQTSGGLLIAVPEDKANDLLNELKASFYPKSSLVGKASRYAHGPYISVE